MHRLLLEEIKTSGGEGVATLTKYSLQYITVPTKYNKNIPVMGKMATHLYEKPYTPF